MAKVSTHVHVCMMRSRIFFHIFFIFSFFFFSLFLSLITCFFTSRRPASLCGYVWVWMCVDIRVHVCWQSLAIQDSEKGDKPIADRRLQTLSPCRAWVNRHYRKSMSWTRHFFSILLHGDTVVPDTTFRFILVLIMKHVALFLAVVDRNVRNESLG